MLKIQIPENPISTLVLVAGVAASVALAGAFGFSPVVILWLV